MSASLVTGLGEKEPEMIHPRAVEALIKQHDRLGALLREIDNGRWWSEDKACRIDEDEVCHQADRIGSALDLIERLAGEMAAEQGTGVGSHPVSTAKRAVPDPIHPGSENLGPFSPGQVGPIHDEI